MKWMISANGHMYDYASAFEKWGFIDWRKRALYAKGDTVYIYCTRPFMRVMYETSVEIAELDSSQIVDDREFWHEISEYEKSLNGKYARLKLLNQADSDYLSLGCLLQHGLKGAPRGPLKVKDELSDYIDKYLHDFANNHVFPESDIDDEAWEGAQVQVKVNRFERSSIARRKCIELHGTACAVCGMEFSQRYGIVGNDFIHIHHIIPLHEINHEYKIDYRNDLIPVCPNCHSMLHRQIDGKYLTVDELKARLCP